MTEHYRLRPQAEIEARLLELIDGLASVDDTNEERVSWHCAQMVALLFALGAEHLTAVGAMYDLWKNRKNNEGDDDGTDNSV